MQNPPTPQDWIKPAEAAKLTGLSPQQLSRLADRGEIGAIRPGVHRRYARLDVEALTESAPSSAPSPSTADEGVLSSVGGES